mmetsp:Transcript_23887/g.49320  ORF Transcript_23887/g.49320 Transcript_23887/m.49320 type:complete len:160 (+) Transcript_23887:1072-1551(+)
MYVLVPVPFIAPSIHSIPAVLPSPTSTMATRIALLLVSIVIAICSTLAAAQEVRVVTKQEGAGPPVTKENKYSAHVTLYIDDGDKTPSGWSTRKGHGADFDRPFPFQPGVNLIEGWSEGVLKMREGERAELYVPSEKGYKDRAMGGPDQAFYIPANSNL